MKKFLPIILLLAACASTTKQMKADRRPSQASGYLKSETTKLAMDSAPRLFAQTLKIHNLEAKDLTADYGTNALTRLANATEDLKIRWNRYVGRQSPSTHVYAVSFRRGDDSEAQCVGMLSPGAWEGTDYVYISVSGCEVGGSMWKMLFSGDYKTYEAYTSSEMVNSAGMFASPIIK